MLREGSTAFRTAQRVAILFTALTCLAHRAESSPMPRPWLRLRGGNQNVEDRMLPKDTGLSTTYSLATKQQDAFDELFNRVKPIDADAAGPWKVVVYDSHWRDIFALSLSPLDMSFYGVPMHSHISAPNRSDAQEVPAMYFLRPTKTNLQAVSSDMKQEKYECAYIHVSGPTNATDWEPIREEASASSGKIKSACDVYCDFLSLEDDTFELGIRDCYYRLHQPSLSEGVPDLIDSIANGLFNVLITCDLRPVIRAQRGTVAHQVAMRLLARMRDAIARDPKAFDAPHSAAAAASFFSSSSEDALKKKKKKNKRSSRPLLLLFDRTHDLALMLHHHCSYRALLHDCLGIHVNAVSLPAPPPPPQASTEEARKKEEGGEGGRRAGGGGGGGGVMTLPLSTREDSFWRETAELPLPDAVAELERRLAIQAPNPAKEKEEEEEDKEQESLKGQAARLFEKRLLELHTKLVTNLADHVRERALDDFFEVEARILSAPATTNIDAVEDLLGGYRVQAGGDERAGANSRKEDRLRLFVMLYLRCALDEDLLTHLFKYLSKLGCDLRLFGHLGALKTSQHSLSFTQRTSIVSGLFSAGADRLKMLTRDRKPGITAVRARELLGVEEEGGDERVAEEEGEFSLVDLWKDEGDADFDHVMVFMVGGGNYVERDDVRHTLNACGHPVVYGTTDMVSPEQMLRQLSESAEVPSSK